MGIEEGIFWDEHLLGLETNLTIKFIYLKNKIKKMTKMVERRTDQVVHRGSTPLIESG